MQTQRVRIMTERQQDYDKRAQEYEHEARLVTDRWVRQRYLTLAKRCREMQKTAQDRESPPGARIAR
jgi:hypothetical protein